MKFSDLDLSKSYTYADYLTWDFPERLELLLGKIFRMSPAPSTGHQDLLRKMIVKLDPYFGKNMCNVFPAPFDVRLPLSPGQVKPEQIDTVVQPDLCVVCDLSKLDKRGCLGPPDWVIEIMSPGTSKKDAQQKFDIYQNAGVKEYWMVYPAEKHIAVFTLNDEGLYIGHRPFVEGDSASPYLFPELVLDLSDLFPPPAWVEEPYATYMREDD